MQLTEILAIFVEMMSAKQPAFSGIQSGYVEYLLHSL
jgi:hypothetical protein